MGSDLADQAFRASFARDAMMPNTEVEDMMDAKLAKLPIENALAKLPIEPRDRAEPTDPIDRTEFLEPIESREFSERTLQRDDFNICIASHDVP